MTYADDVGDEVDDIVVVIPDLLDKHVKRRIEKYRDEVTEQLLESALLQESRDNIINRLKKTREYLALLKKQVSDGQSDRCRAGDGLEPKLFEVLRTIGVELTRYHGGSLNGKDIKTVTDNATYVFNEWSKILCNEKRRDSIDAVVVMEKCEQFKKAFLLWDGDFLMRKKSTQMMST